MAICAAQARVAQKVVCAAPVLKVETVAVDSADLLHKMVETPPSLKVKSPLVRSPQKLPKEYKKLAL